MRRWLSRTMKQDLLTGPNYYLLLQNYCILLVSVLLTILQPLLCIQVIKLFAPTVWKTRTCVGTHEAPQLIVFHTFHEQIRNPQCIKEIPSSNFLLSCVFLQVKKFKHICMPRFQINSKCSRALKMKAHTF